MYRLDLQVLTDRVGAMSASASSRPISPASARWASIRFFAITCLLTLITAFNHLLLLVIFCELAHRLRPFDDYDVTFDLVRAAF